MSLRALWLLVPLAAACSDDPPPVEVSAGRLVARIYPDPARIALVLDDKEVWSTRGDSSGGKPPNGFAAIGTRAGTIEFQFGSFKFNENENNESWQSITELTDITETSTGATFKLRGSDRELGTGTLTFVTATKSGPDPDAAGFPRHVRIELATPNAQRIQLASKCDATEHLVGLGGQSFDIDHRGETVPLWVQEDGIGKYPDEDNNYQGVWPLNGRKHSTHTPMPMLLSSRGYAVAVDTNARAVFDLCDSNKDAARFEAWSQKLDFQVFIGDPAAGATKDAFGHMIAWVGKPQRPPELIFAPWVDAMFGSANVRRVAQKLRTNGVSSSVIWTEDWRGGQNGATGYGLDEDWRVDRALYPDFEQLATDLHGMGFAFHTYQNTFIDDTSDVYSIATSAGYAIKKEDSSTYEFTGVLFSPSTLLDLSNPAAVTWAKGVMTEGLTLGADGWMADFAEWLPHDAVLASGESALDVHNRYPVDWARMNKEMFANTPTAKPGIYFMRSAWLHSQPNVQVMWAGDQQTDWSEGDGYPSVIPIGLGMGLAGLPYFGHDIGGYMSQGTVSTSEELFYRWTTMGALSPVMRTHHGRNVTTNVQWEYNAGTLAHFALWSRFHLQLATYMWGSIGSYERDGLPLFRTLLLDYPNEDWTWTAIDEYLLGDRILVAPILQEGATSRQVHLPASTEWSRLFDGAPVGNGMISSDADRSGMPVFVPAGAVVVLYGNYFDTLLDAPGLSSATTKAELNNSREVWLYSGTAANPDHARWNDDTGPVGTAHWTWSGRAAGAHPTTATFNGAAVTVTEMQGSARVTVNGNGTLAFGDGSTLTIQRSSSGTTYIKLF